MNHVITMTGVDRICAALAREASENRQPFPDLANHNPNHDERGRFASAPSVGYLPEHYAQIGKSGGWKALGLPDARSIRPDSETPDTDKDEARARLEKGEVVTDPSGKRMIFGKTSLRHFSRKDSQLEIGRRLAALDKAKKAAEEPHEVWYRKDTRRSSYIRFEKGKDGRLVIHAVSTRGEEVYSWHTNDMEFNHGRNGKLLYLRPRK